MKTNIILIREYFGTERAVTMDEMKALTAADRTELGAAIAAQLGLKPVEGAATPTFA